LREALNSYQASLAIMARLAKADLGNAGWQRDLSVTYVRLADFYRKSGRSSDARKALATARVIMARLVASAAGEIETGVRLVRRGGGALNERAPGSWQRELGTPVPHCAALHTGDALPSTLPML
jgi:hypothetical protein